MYENINKKAPKNKKAYDIAKVYRKEKIN